MVSAPADECRCEEEMRLFGDAVVREVLDAIPINAGSLGRRRG
jgi:hypothetical protein